LLKPKKVTSKLREVKKVEDEKIDVNYDQVKRYCYHQKVKYYKQNLKNTVADLRELLKTYTYNANINDEDMFILSQELDLSKFNVIFSSRALLVNAINQEHKVQSKSFNGFIPSFFHLDGTYKLVDSGFVTLVLGTENILHQFRPIAFAIVAHEDQAAYNKLLKEVKKFLQDNFNFNYSPKYALMDGARSSYNATVQVFGKDMKIILCWFHLLKAIRNHIYQLKDAADKKYLRENWPFVCYGLGLLAKTRTHNDFLDLWKIMKENWNDELQLPEDFLKYIETEYIKSNLIWNQSTFIGKSRSNNSLESFNNQLKMTYFEAKKFDLISFFRIAKSMVRDFSRDLTSFPKTIEVPLNDWRFALTYSKTATIIKSLKRNHFAFIKKSREEAKRNEREKYKFILSFKIKIF